MIYNENGIIINEEYILDCLLNESISDVANGIIKTAVDIGNSILNVLSSFIDYFEVHNFYRLYRKIKISKDAWLHLGENDKTDLTKIVFSYGHDYLFGNFYNACDALKNNNDLSVEELEKILYSENGKYYPDHKDEWFKSKETSPAKIKIENIVSYIDDNKYLIYLRGAYRDIKVINTTITKNKPIKAEVMKTLHSHLINTISIIKQRNKIFYKLIVKTNELIKNGKQNFNFSDGSMDISVTDNDK